ncbi:MAG: ATP-binding cassette domain-containing protein [Spirochaetales bacterium]|nr:ATP-binding cassette domain-containing protein [Spirochaetales bacterium]
MSEFHPARNPSHTKVPSCRELSFKYPDYPGLKAEQLFDLLDFTPEVGRINLIVGGADMGKTTLARILMGLIPLFTGGTLGGELLWGGQKVDKIPRDEMMRCGGLIFQDPEEQLISPSCEQEVAFGLESLGVPEEIMRARVGKALSWAGLSGAEDRKPASLSGGEQKRLLTAALMAIDPHVWILDEIFEELDESFREKLLNYLADHKKCAIIFASKYLDIYSRYDPVITIIENRKLKPVDIQSAGALLSKKGFTFLPEDWTRRPPGSPSKGSAFPSAPRYPGEELLLDLRDIKFSYPGGGFNLDITRLALSRGETIAFIGDNGSGKSTLARIICGLLSPSAGQILQGDPDKSNLEANKKACTAENLRKTCGYLFQNPDYQLFLPSITEELLYGYKGKKRKSMNARTEEVMGLFNLPSGEAPPSLLGYGTRRKLQGAVAYLQERSILILDEGDSGLNYSDFLKMVALLKTPERCLILISHQQAAVKGISDRVFKFNRGRVEEAP